MFTLRFDTSDVERELGFQRDQLADIRPVWREMANVMRASFRENFRSAGRPIPWRRLAPNTVASKSYHGYEEGAPYATARGRRRIRRLEQVRGGKAVRSLTNILVFSGSLRDSYAHKNRDHVERISHERLEIGSKHWLAHFHEHGTRPYTIHPKKKRALSFITVGGRVIRGKVEHPGLAARPVALIQQEDEERFYDLLREHFDAA